MTKNRTLYLTSEANNSTLTYPATSTATIDLFTPVSDGTVLRNILFRNNDSSDRTFIIYLNKASAGDVEIGRIIVPANAGNGTVTLGALTNLLPSIFRYDNSSTLILPLKFGDVLRIAAVANLTNAMFMSRWAEDQTAL